jgi:hypothetical protein
MSQLLPKLEKLNNERKELENQLLQATNRLSEVTNEMEMLITTQQTTPDRFGENPTSSLTVAQSSGASRSSDTKEITSPSGGTSPSSGDISPSSGGTSPSGGSSQSSGGTSRSSNAKLLLIFPSSRRTLPSDDEDEAPTLVNAYEVLLSSQNKRKKPNPCKLIMILLHI